MNLKLLNPLNENEIYNIKFPVQLKGEISSPEIELHLWNRKDKVCNYIATNIKIYALNYNKTISNGTNYDGQELIDENLIFDIINGVEGSGIIDDAQTSYTALGTISYAQIGDIPVNCCRKLFFKINAPKDLETNNCIFYIKICYNYERQSFYNIIKTNTERLFFGCFLGSDFF